MTCPLPPVFPKFEIRFGIKMVVHGEGDESAVVWPISVISALAMLEDGAKGETKSQIANAIANGCPDEYLQSYYSHLSSLIQQANNDVFFLNKQYNIDKDYESTIIRKYSAKVQSLDFTSTSDAAKTINDFIESTTQGKIQDMIVSTMMEGAFSLIVDAIHFSAKWSVPFESTTKGTFYNSATNRRQVDFMNAYRRRAMYAEDHDLKVLSLPYEDTSFAFNIILPKTSCGLEEFHSVFAGSKIQWLLSRMEMTDITYKIPKMKIETDLKLKEALIAMGVSEMFSGGADFSGVTESPSLRISDAVHRAIIEVDEEGTTASAANGFVATAGSAFTLDEPKKFEADHPSPFILTKDKKFEADHPFWFMLAKDNNPLFIGQFV
ncbi:hypothetical protein Q1695_004109 [Nippostrongylus brasiliensis]|nr:hypothetical protein Q1695_004109 [Nippostrongylus brasiliensis]